MNDLPNPEQQTRMICDCIKIMTEDLITTYNMRRMYAPLPSEEEEEPRIPRQLFKPRQRRTAPSTLWGLSLLTIGLIVAISTAIHQSHRGTWGSTSPGPVLTSVSEKWGLPEQIFYFKKSSTLLMLEKGTKVLRRSQDQGKSWSVVQGMKWDGDTPDSLVLHPYAQEDTAFLMGSGNIHYKTLDKGETWVRFRTGEALPRQGSGARLVFHAKSPERILFNGRVCANGGSSSCSENIYYTDNYFDSMELLLPNAQDCLWAFNAAGQQVPSSRLYCTEQEDGQDYRLVSSDSYFANSNLDKRVLDLGGSIVGLTNMEAFIVVAVKLKSENSNTLFVSSDGKAFSEAQFPGSSKDRRVRFILASRDILSSSSPVAPPFGTLYFSNDQGTAFTRSLEHTNRARNSFVDFETIQAYNYNGILLANVVDNYKEVLESEDPTSDELKKIISKMSFDHGGSWQDLRGPSKDISGKAYPCVSGKCTLHLHSVTHPHNLGKVFSSTSAPGLVLGVGSVGARLSPYESCDTFLSTDAGQTWKNIAKGPYKYESADAGSLLVLVPDTAQPQHTILYSYDWGTNWKTKDLTLESKSWIPYFTMLDPDSTFQIVLMFALDPDNRSEGWMVQLDFSQAQERRCDLEASHPEQSEDFELWTVGATSSECLLGQTVSYYRRKPTADCSVGQDFALPEMITKSCACSSADYTCDTKYHKVTTGGSDFTCEADEEGDDQPRDCPIGTTYRAKSGFRKVPGDKCDGGLQKPEWIEKPCRVKKNAPDPKKPADGSSHSEPTTSVFVPDSQVAQLVYIANSSVLFLRSEMGLVYKSFDEGKIWRKVSELESHGAVNSMEVNHAKPSKILFMTTSAIYYMDDSVNFDKIQELSLPQEPNDFGAPIIDFHPTEADWYLFTGGLKSCSGAACHSVTYMTKNNGKEWKEVDSWSRKCTWARWSQSVSLESDDIYCHSYMSKSGEIGQDKLDAVTDKSKNPEQFILINNHGTGHVTMKDKGVFGFYTISNLLVVAAKEKENASKLFVSSDGLELSEAQFPPQVLLKENSFTLLPATNNGVFLDVSVADSDLVGSLFKSNQDGRFLSQSLAATHRDTQGRVDFDRVQDIDGILFANTYDNPTDLPSSRRIRSVLSFDDGATWNYIKAPKKDSEDKETCSSADVDSCYLHLHSHVDIVGLRSAFSAKGNSGLILGIGNVGANLESYPEGNLYISREGGASWKEAQKGPHKWVSMQYGNVIVIAKAQETITKLSYSLDFGDSWKSFTFADKPVQVQALLTHPDSSSFQVLLVSRPVKDASSSAISIHQVDFSSVIKRKCSESEDTESWSPANPDSSCFLGQSLSFFRRKSTSICYVSKSTGPRVPVDVKSCQCTDADYECEVNFFRNNEGDCVLYGSDPDEPARCKSGDLYMGSSGYRKIAASKCEGGKDLTQKVSRMCGTNTKPGPIKIEAKQFNRSIEDFFYYNRSTILVVRDVEGSVYQSSHDGSDWSPVMPDVHVVSLMLDPYRGNRAFLLSKTLVVGYSNNLGQNYQTMSLPVVPDLTIVPEPLQLHPEEENWLLFTGVSNCESASKDCQTESYVSWNHGGSWALIRRNALSCSWGRNKKFKSTEKAAIFCLQARAGADPRSFISPKEKMLVKSQDGGRGESSFVDVFSSGAFATFEQYMISLSIDDSSSRIVIRVSLDGELWAPSHFPSSFQLPDGGFTILDSSTGSIFLQILVNKAQSYGNLFRSNWNGTYYSLSLENVNEDSQGHVDFEKVIGIDGVALANQLQSIHDPNKRLVTKITFDDGESWQKLVPPRKDSKGVQYSCTDCSLNLHAFTERRDPTDQYSAASATGMIMAVGNVGRELTPYTDGRTFLSRDAGTTWEEIMPDAFMFEFAASGTVFILVNDETPTDTVRYSINQGKDIRELKISDHIGGGRLQVKNILTESSATTSHFVILGSVKGGAWDDTFAAIHLDFSRIWERDCLFDDDEHKSDFEKWSLFNDTCHFGKKEFFYRRKAERDCIPTDLYMKPRVDSTLCECTRSDFECDYNYFMNGGSDCILGSNMQNPEPTCVDGFKRYTVGYRKKQISSCSGGVESELQGRLEPCGSVTGPASWLWTILLYIFILGGMMSAAVYYFSGRFERIGAIRLPAERDSRPRLTVVFLDLVDGISQGLNQIANWISDKATSVASFFRSRGRRRNGGYQPVQSIPTSSFDQAREDNCLMDLEEY